VALALSRDFYPGDQAKAVTWSRGHEGVRTPRPVHAVPGTWEAAAHDTRRPRVMMLLHRILPNGYA